MCVWPTQSILTCVAYHESLAKSGTVMKLLMSMLKEKIWIITPHNIVIMTVVMNTLRQKNLKHNEAIISTVRVSYKQCILSKGLMSLLVPIYLESSSHQTDEGKQVVRIRSKKSILVLEFQVAWPITAGGDKCFIFFTRTWRKINSAFFGWVQYGIVQTLALTQYKKNVMMQNN